MKKSNIGRPKLPRDEKGRIIRPNEQKKVILRKAPAKPQPVKLEQPADNFLAAADESIKKIELETQNALNAQETIKSEEPADIAPDLEKTPPAAANDFKMGSFDYTDIVSPVIRGGGLYLANKAECDELAFTDEETAKLAKATSDLLNVMFPDLEELTPKEKVILSSAAVFINVAQAKAGAYQRHKAKKKTEIKAV